MSDQETWRFINSFAPWLSAIGTIFAVSVSLYLARRSSHVKLAVTVSIKFGIEPGTQSRVDYLHIKAVNNGFRDATVAGLAWRIRWPKARLFIVLPPDNRISTKLPAKLTYGDDASFLFPVTEFPTLAKSMLQELRTRHLPFTLRRCRVGVYTSTGETFWVPLDKRMRDWFQRQVHPT